MLFSISIEAQQQWYFSVDERYPAERNDLQSKRRVLLVNNTLLQPDAFGHSTVIDGENKGGIEVDLTRSVLYCLFSATQTMDISGEFESVELLDISQNTSTNYYSRKTLQYVQAEQLCAEYQADALLILNQLVIYDILETFLTQGEQYYAYLQAFAQSYWTIHYAGQSREVNFNYADTLLWESDLHYTRAQSLANIPPRQEALLYLAKEVGYKVGSSFMPSWQTNRRYIYELPELEKGLAAFRYQRWNEAIVLWQQVITLSKDKKATATAAANIAISYEMLGDYDSACDYAQRAIRLFGAWKTAYGRQQQANIRYYLAHLQERKAREHGR